MSRSLRGMLFGDTEDNPLKLRSVHTKKSKNKGGVNCATCIGTHGPSDTRPRAARNARDRRGVQGDTPDGEASSKGKSRRETTRAGSGLRDFACLQCPPWDGSGGGFRTVKYFLFL